MRRTTISHSREVFIPNQGQYASWANSELSIMDQTQDLGDRLTEIGRRDILPHGLFRIHRLMQDGEISIDAMLIDRGSFFCRTAAESDGTAGRRAALGKLCDSDRRLAHRSLMIHSSLAGDDKVGGWKCIRDVDGFEDQRDPGRQRSI